MTKRSLYCIYK